MPLFNTRSETLQSCLEQLFNDDSLMVETKFQFNEVPEYFGTWEFQSFEDFRDKFLPKIGKECINIKLTVRPKI